MQRHTAQKRKERDVRTVGSSSPKATRRRMTRQKQEQCWTKGSWRKREQRQCSKQEKSCMQLRSMRPAFTVLVEELKDCEELRPKPKEKVELRGSKKEERRSIERSGVLKPTGIDA